MPHTERMPTYTYRCQKCGEEIEVVQSMSDPPLKRCRSCRGALKRIFHPVGIVLKGSGFYKTDYGGGGRRAEKSEKSEKAEKPEKKESSSGTSEGTGAKDGKSSGPSD